MGSPSEPVDELRLSALQAMAVESLDRATGLIYGEQPADPVAAGEAREAAAQDAQMALGALLLVRERVADAEGVGEASLFLRETLRDASCEELTVIAVKALMELGDLTDGFALPDPPPSVRSVGRDVRDLAVLGWRSVWWPVSSWAYRWRRRGAGPPEGGAELGENPTGGPD